MNRFAAPGKLLLFAAVAICLGSAGAVGQSPSHPGDAAKKLIGTWRLVSLVEPSPESTAWRGVHSTGLLTYDGTGHMSVQIMPDRVRPKFAGAEPTPEEAKLALMGYSAYFGTYTVDESTQTVTHHREGNITPGVLGDFKRRYVFETDDWLILSPLDKPNPPTYLTWERVK